LPIVTVSRILATIIVRTIDLFIEDLSFE